MTRTPAAPTVVNSAADTPEPVARRNLWPRVLVGLLIGGGVLGYWLYSNSATGRLARRAEALLESNPEQAERLAAEATAMNGWGVADAWLIRGRSLLKQRKSLEAAGCWGSIPDPSSASQAQLVAFADEALQLGERRLAEFALEAALAHQGRTARLVRLQLALKSQEMDEQKFQALTEELSKLPGADAEVWITLAETYVSRGNLDQAVQACYMALAQMAHSAPPKQVSAGEIRGKLAQLLIDLGKFEEARRFIYINSADMSATPADKIREAHLLRFDGKNAEAIELLTQILKEHPEQHKARLLRGTLYSEMKDLPAARADLEAVVEELSYLPEAHYRLGQLYQKLGLKAEAEQRLARQAELAAAEREILSVLEKIRQQPQNASLMYQLAAHYRTLGQTRQAERWTEAANQHARGIKAGG